MREKSLKYELLINEYDKRHTYNRLYIDAYEKNIIYLLLYFAIFFTVVGFSCSNKGLLNVIQNKNQSVFIDETFIILILTFSMSIVFYFLSYLLDKSYLIYINVRRIQVVEYFLNEEVGEDILIFEEKIRSHFYSEKWLSINHFLKPQYLVSLCFFLGVIIYVIIHCMFCSILSPTYLHPYVCFVAFFLLMLIYRFYTINTKDIEFSHKHDEYVKELTIMPTDAFSKKTPILIPILTFIFGFLSFAVLSYKINAFSLSSPYEFPFMAVPSVYIGDALFLPLINYRIGKVLLQEIDNGLIYKNKIFFSIWIIITLLMSLLINFKTHDIWTQDIYNGFMDINHVLTLAGKWHLWFSVFNMFFISILLFLIIVSFREKNKELIEYNNLTWKFFVGFTIMSFFDFIYRHEIINKANSLIENIWNEKMNFITIYLSISIWVIIKVIERKRHRT